MLHGMKFKSKPSHAKRATKKKNLVDVATDNIGHDLVMPGKLKQKRATQNERNKGSNR